MKRYQKLIISILCCYLYAPTLLGQHVSEYEEFIHRDTSLHSFIDFFQKGHIEGHVRNYFMATVNQGQLNDYWTNATGGSLKFETAEWYGLQLGVKGIFTYQTFSADLNRLDSLTARGAKWERELYDINRPTERNDLDRLEELYLKLNIGNSFLEIGKIDINEGPLFLRRDGRMKPFVYRGFWSEIEELKHQKISIGLINGVSPRGMTDWFSLREAIGMLNNGYLPDGSPAHYQDHIPIRYILVGGIEFHKSKSLKLQFWNYHFDHLFNTAWFQTDVNHKHFIGGVQYVYQRASSAQSDVHFSDRYTQPNEKSHSFNLLLGFQNLPRNFSARASYYHSLAEGRFLFPKELGRENFYISDARSWMEGLGGMNAYMLEFKYAPNLKKRDQVLLQTRISKVNTSSDYSLNKYNTPDYLQLSTDVRIKFPQKLKGLSIRLLYISRKFQNDRQYSLPDKFYKSNYHHFNLITNVDF